MGKIDELIQQYCPDGVEFKTVKSCAQVGTGSSDRKDASDNGKYPFYVRSKNIEHKDDYEFDEEAIIIPGEGSVGDIFHYVNGKYALHQRAYRIHFTNPSVNTRFVKYYMESAFKAFIMMKAVSSTVSSIRKPMIEDFEIPVPPLPVQEEIVRILDTFTELETELEKKLETEFELRQKQYEYHRDRLLSLEDYDGETERIRLKDIGKVCMCKRIMKAQTNSDSENGIPFFKIGTFGKEPDAFISKDLYEDYKNKYSYPRKGNVLISAAGTIGRTVVFDGGPAYFQDSNIVWIDNDNTKVIDAFLNYVYQTSPWKASDGGTISRLYNSNIENTEICIPKDLGEQQRIVDLLNNFNSLATDISEAIPAEIKMRHQQYEFYRDKLLAFEKKVGG